MVSTGGMGPVMSSAEEPSKSRLQGKATQFILSPVVDEERPGLGSEADVSVQEIPGLWFTALPECWHPINITYVCIWQSSPPLSTGRSGVALIKQAPFHQIEKPEQEGGKEIQDSGQSICSKHRGGVGFFLKSPCALE